MLRAQDIHYQDEANWELFIAYWQAGDYQSAIRLRDSGLLISKYMGADVTNFMTDLLVETQQLNDPTFKQNLIKVANTPPTDLAVGGVYFYNPDVDLVEDEETNTDVDDEIVDEEITGDPDNDDGGIPDIGDIEVEEEFCPEIGDTDDNSGDIDAGLDVEVGFID